MEVYKKYFEVNKICWNARTAVHVKSDFYNVKGFKEGVDALCKIVDPLVSNIKGKTLLHLQCHFGLDSMSLERRGAQVTGMDISDAAIAEANKIREELGLSTRFVECNVLELDQHIQEEFDIVFTSFGALCWLPDLKAWAKQVSARMKKGAQVIIAEFHPVMYMIEWKDHEIKYPYFNRGQPYHEIEEGTYTDGDEKIKTEEYFWLHSLSDVISALINEGIQIQHFQEYDYSPYNCFDNMKERAKGEYVYTINEIPPPHAYSLVGKKG